MLAQVLNSKNSNSVHPLAEKLLGARKLNVKGDPFKKDEFTSLRDIAIEIVAKNFHLYPSLSKVPSYLKAIVI